MSRPSRSLALAPGVAMLLSSFAACRNASPPAHQSSASAPPISSSAPRSDSRAFSRSRTSASRDDRPSNAGAARTADAGFDAGSDGRAHLELQKRQLHDSRPAKQLSAGLDERTCSIDAEYPEVTSGLSPAIRALVNRTLRPKEAVLGPSCDFATSYEVRYRVIRNDPVVLSVLFENAACCGAHPSYSERSVNVWLRTGKAVTYRELFPAQGAAEIAAKLTQRAREALTAAGDREASDDWIASLLQTPPDFTVEARGIRFSLYNVTPHAIQDVFKDGFLFSCGELGQPGRGPRVQELLGCR